MWRLERTKEGGREGKENRKEGGNGHFRKSQRNSSSTDAFPQSYSMTCFQGQWKSQSQPWVWVSGRLRVPEDSRGLEGQSCSIGDADLWSSSQKWAVLPFLQRWTAGAAYCICRYARECMCFINGANALCFWLMGHQSHSCWAVIDFPTLLLQLCHRCSLSEVRGPVL